jgi:hypothetical protein
MKRPRRRMSLAARASRIGQQLDELFPRPPIPLDHEDAFTLLIAVVLSAQCTDARVNQTAPHLFARASTPEAMARLRPSTIERIIRPCGLAPAKSKNIHRLSQLLVERHGGQVPRSFEELEALATRPPAWSWPRLSACRRFRSTRTSIVWPGAGACRSRARWRRWSAI